MQPIYKNFNWFIGAQVVEADESGITVLKDGVEYTFKFKIHHGDCCGYSEGFAALLYEKDSKRNPVITKIEELNDADRDCETLKITLFGEDKALAEINSESGSGSGWCYGATTTLTCINHSDIQFDLTSW